MALTHSRLAHSLRLSDLRYRKANLNFKSTQLLYLAPLVSVLLGLGLAGVLLRGLGLFLDNLLDDLLLLDQESSHDSLLDTVGATRATVDTGHGLAGLGQSGVSSWSHGSNTWKSDTAVTTLRSRHQLFNVLGVQHTAWGLDDPDLVRAGVVYEKKGKC